MDKITRAEAKKQGLRFYFTGEPCAKGHVAKRVVKNYTCYTCVKAAGKRDVYGNQKRRAADYYLENREEKLKKSKEWREKAKAEGRLKNRKKSPEVKRVQDHKRRMRQKAAGGYFKVKDIREMMANQFGKCKSCECNILNNYHVDHIMPLALGGSNWPENLQLLCPDCNIEKGARHPDDWVHKKDR